MMKIFYLLITGTMLAFHSCNTKEDITYWRESYQNDSSQAVSITGFSGSIGSVGVTTVFDTLLQPGQRVLSCEYSLLNRRALACIDSIRIIFPNGKGYVCGSPVKGEKCFESRNPMVSISIGFYEVEKKHDVFFITEEDYLNAKELD